jgi:hypothetical protein
MEQPPSIPKGLMGRNNISMTVHPAVTLECAADGDNEELNGKVASIPVMGTLSGYLVD